MARCTSSQPKGFFMTKLNHEQQKVAQAIQGLQAGDRLVVSGRAGSGKTFAIANSVSNRRALFLAPTHPTRTVLEQEVQGKTHKVMTIHSAIGWYRRRDEELNWVDCYVPAKDAKNRSIHAPDQKLGLFGEVDLIIVDEFSMVGSFLFRAIEDYANEYGLPVVYSGDRFQLPPVRDREVIMDQGFNTITLEQSMRFSQGSEIFEFGEVIREMIERRPKDEIGCVIGGASVQMAPGSQWMNELKQSYEQCESFLAVTSDNKTLQRLRGKVRQLDHDRFVAGDFVISKQTDELFRNGEQLTIAQIDPGTRVLLNVPDCVSRLKHLTVYGQNITFLETSKTAFILDGDKEAEKLDQRIRRLFLDGCLGHEEAARVLDWLDQINRFELSALATVHKSQGRSVDTVFIDTNTVLKRPDWLSNEKHKRLLYTAVTRARERVVFYEMAGYCTAARHGAVETDSASVGQAMVEA